MLNILRILRLNIVETDLTVMIHSASLDRFWNQSKLLIIPQV